jgi:hypothetical protein
MGQEMSLRVERAQFDPVNGFLYYVIFKPNLQVGVDEVQMTSEVEAALSLTENGDLADLTFIVPKQYRNPVALSFVCAEGRGSYQEPHVYVAVEGSSGDTVVRAPGRLDVDLAGRIVGMAIQWQPTQSALA